MRQIILTIWKIKKLEKWYTKQKTKRYIEKPNIKNIKNAKRLKDEINNIDNMKKKLFCEKRTGVVEPELGAGLGLNVRQRPGESRSSERTEDNIPWHSPQFVLSPLGTCSRFWSERKVRSAPAQAAAYRKRKGQGPRGKEAKRQRGREAERQRFACHFLNIFHFRWWFSVVCTTQLPVMDVSARTTWRVQRCVISIVNCRIQWTNRKLNAHCSFGLLLKARLLQCLLFFCWACHSGVTFSCFHVSMYHALHSHMCLGGGLAQRWTSSSGLMLRVIKPLQCF